MNNAYEPIIVNKNKDGKIVLTQKELEKLLKKAYMNGYNAREIMYISHPAITTPSSPYYDGTKIIW